MSDETITTECDEKLTNPPEAVQNLEEEGEGYPVEFIEDGEWLEEDVVIHEEDLEREATELEAAMASMDEQDLAALVDGAIDDLSARGPQQTNPEVEAVVEGSIETEVEETRTEARQMSQDNEEVTHVEVIHAGDANEEAQPASGEQAEKTIDPFATAESVPVVAVINYEALGQSSLVLLLTFH